MSTIQSVLFDKNFYTTEDACKWLHKHKLKPIKKVHETENYYRYRLQEPCKQCTCRTIQLKPGLKMLVKYC